MFRKKSHQEGHQLVVLSELSISVQGFCLPLILFILDLNKDSNILKIENVELVKASTESNGDAFVEYSVEVTFKASDHTHTIKLTAYTTSSQVMIQPLGEKPQVYNHLVNKGTPRYFAEHCGYIGSFNFQ